jgi:hypothetical protein
MNEIKFETMRAKGAVDVCQKQFDDAVAFAARMADDLQQAVKQGWNVQCPANNLANAAAEVGRIGARLEVLLDAYSVLASLNA